jgi:eukaryotic-like serine/threonine-protein kinase
MHCLLGAGVSETMTEQQTAQPVPPALPDFGPYHTVGVLGEGGMGIVYLAEQRQPVRRRVALKVLKSADLGSTVLARFESESQALALMEHPNIARIYNAGTTSGGRPYFAMEYVPGIPITDYCDRNLLGFRERLALFQQVCQAVHHAHQRGIIHRDIKPSNVLITLQDGKPVPKVIDFGVAKALNQRLVEKTLFTEAGMLIGTPEYMSPEQADLTGLDIDSTTDIYSLGVLLYELLVGALPFDSKTLRKAGYAEIQRIIRETEPPKLSTRLSSMGGQAAQEVARQRQSDVRGMARLLRGDLEWITMKALEKDRTRRYASASEFAADIARHLANEPVVAAAPRITYQAAKFVRRHRGMVAAASAVMAALLIGAVVSFALYLKASKEQEIAQSESYSANLSAADMQLREGLVREAKFRLANTPVALRGWEWRYLMASTDQSTATVYSRDFTLDVKFRGRRIVFSEDGEQFISAGDTILRSWDVRTKRLVTEFSGLGRILAIGPHGKTVLVTSPLSSFADLPKEGCVLRLYDVNTRRLLAELRGMARDPGESAISDDGTLVASAPDYEGTDPILVWEVRTGKVVARLEGAPQRFNAISLRFSPDGKRLASVYYPGSLVQLWNLTGTPRLIQLPHNGQVYGVAFSPDGSKLASVCKDDDAVRIWDPATGALLRSWHAAIIGPSRVAPNYSNLGAIAWSPDGAQLAMASDTIIRVRDAATGALLRELHGYVSPSALAFHPTSPRLYTSGSGLLQEWDLGSQGSVLDEAKDEVGAVAVSPNGKYFASGSRDGFLRIYDARTNRLMEAWKGHSGEVTSLAFSPDSLALASSSSDTTVKVWRVLDGITIRTFTGHTGNVWSAAFSPDGRQIASGSEDETIRIWDLTSGGLSATIQPKARISRVAFSPDGRTILALRMNDKSLLLYDATSKLSIGTLSSGTVEGASPMPRSFALSLDGGLVAGPATTGTSIALWDLPKRRLIQILPAFPSRNRISSMALSPDGTRLAVGGETLGTISIFDVRRARLLVTLGSHISRVPSLAWTPDGSRLISGSTDRTVRIWDASSPYNYDAELLVDKVSEDRLLLDDVVQELNADRTIPPELRKEAIEIAVRRGPVAYHFLQGKAALVGGKPGLPREDYRQALRLAKAAAAAAPWVADTVLTVALLQYRVGEFDLAAASAQRAIDIQKGEAKQAQAIRAMAYYQLHDLTRARQEIESARKLANQDESHEGEERLEEAEALIGIAKKPRP